MRLGISWGYLMVILPLDHKKFSRSPPTKDPVMRWCPVPGSQVMEEPSWSKLEEFGVVLKCLEDTNVSAGVAVGPSGATPAVNTSSWGERGTLYQEKCCCRSSTVPVSKAMTSHKKMLMEKVAMKISFAPDRLGNRHLPAGEIPCLTPKLYLLMADSTGAAVGWHGVGPKIKGRSLSPSLGPPLLHAGAVRRSPL